MCWGRVFALLTVFSHEAFANKDDLIEGYYAGGAVVYSVISDDGYFGEVNDGSGFKDVLSFSLLGGIQVSSILSFDLELSRGTDFTAMPEFSSESESLSLNTDVFFISAKQRFPFSTGNDFWYIKESIGLAVVEQKYTLAGESLTVDEEVVTPGLAFGVEREYLRRTTPFVWYTELRLNAFQVDGVGSSSSGKPVTHDLVFSSFGMGLRWVF